MEESGDEQYRFCLPESDDILSLVLDRSLLSKSRSPSPISRKNDACDGGDSTAITDVLEEKSESMATQAKVNEEFSKTADRFDLLYDLMKNYLSLKSSSQCLGKRGLKELNLKEIKIQRIFWSSFFIGETSHNQIVECKICKKQYQNKKQLGGHLARSKCNVSENQYPKD